MISKDTLEIFLFFFQVAFYGEPTNVPSLFVEAYLKSTTKEFRMSENAPKIDAKNPAGWCYLIYQMKSNHSLRKQPFLLAPFLAPRRWGRFGCFRRLIKPQLGKHILQIRLS